MSWPSARSKTAEKDGTWSAADMNSVQDQILRPDGIEADDLELAVTRAAGLSVTADSVDGAAKYRGVFSRTTQDVIEVTDENVETFQYMPTFDVVSNITVAEPSLLHVAYKAMVGRSDINACMAAIFLGDEQLSRVDFGEPDPVPDQELFGQIQTSFSVFTNLITTSTGLTTMESSTVVPTPTYNGDVTTGQTISPITVFADAGTYSVGVKFLGYSPGNFISALNRTLWVWCENLDD